MQSGLVLLSELSDSDLAWLLSAGRRERVPANAVVVREATHVPSLYLILHGLLSVYLTSLGGEQLAILGAGQIFGEMSLLENRPASATVRTLEDSELLNIPRSVIDQKLESDHSFAARFYRALAQVTSRRLRELVGTLGRWLEDQPPTDPKTMSRWTEIAERTQRFKELLLDIDQQPAKADASDDLRLSTAFQEFGLFTNKALGDGSLETMDAREELGARIQREVLPYLLKSPTIERIYTKPRGYTGDFQINELFNPNPKHQAEEPSVLDRSFRALPPVVAVRNRSQFITDQLNAIPVTAEGPFRITALCSGAGDELFAMDDLAGHLGNFAATLIDFDVQALATAAEKSDSLGCGGNFRLINSSLLDLAIGLPVADLPKQDFVYSIGLPDYLDDRLLMKLLNYMHGLLKPGGRAIISSFHSDNPFKAFMDYIVDWRVTHRREGQIDEVFKLSKFQQPCSHIQLEATGIIILAECQKI